MDVLLEECGKTLDFHGLPAKAVVGRVLCCFDACLAVAVVGEEEGTACLLLIWCFIVVQYAEDSLNILGTYPPLAPSSLDAWSE